jgi:hypothetical protein
VLLGKGGGNCIRVRTFGQRDAVLFVSERDVNENLILLLLVIFDSLRLRIFFNKILIFRNCCFSLLNIRFCRLVRFFVR